MKYFSLEGGKGESEKRGLGVSPSCRFLIRGEPPNKNAASGAIFQDRGRGKGEKRETRKTVLHDLGKCCIIPS